MYPWEWIVGKRENSCGVLVMGSLPVASCFLPQSCGGWEEELCSACGSKREAGGVSRQVIATAVSRVLPPDHSRAKELEQVDWWCWRHHYLLLPLLPWEVTAALVQESCFLVLWVIDRKLQVLSLSNWCTCPRVLGIVCASGSSGVLVCNSNVTISPLWEIPLLIPSCQT